MPTPKRKLSVRSEGPTQLARKVTVKVTSSEEEDLLKDRLLILIHGYNTSETDASQAFETFRDRLQAVEAMKMLGDAWEFHWPGDIRSRFWSRATYLARIGDARGAGQLLANFLDRRTKRRQRVVIVAHSLGCRVALETAQAIIELGPLYRGARLRHLVLLAAAVPVEGCVPTATDLWPHPLVGCREHVVYSLGDEVLRFGFPAGQKGYGEPGDAVGLEGYPLERWMTRKRTWLDHADYWHDRKREVATQIANVVGACPPRLLNPWRTKRWSIAVREEPEERDLPSMEPRRREISE